MEAFDDRAKRAGVVVVVFDDDALFLKRPAEFRVGCAFRAEGVLGRGVDPVEGLSHLFPDFGLKNGAHFLVEGRVLQRLGDLVERFRISAAREQVRSDGVDEFGRSLRVELIGVGSRHPVQRELQRPQADGVGGEALFRVRLVGGFEAEPEDVLDRGFRVFLLESLRRLGRRLRVFGVQRLQRGTDVGEDRRGGLGRQFAGEARVDERVELDDGFEQAALLSPGEVVFLALRVSGLSGFERLLHHGAQRLELGVVVARRVAPHGVGAHVDPGRGAGLAQHLEEIGRRQKALILLQQRIHFRGDRLGLGSAFADARLLRGGDALIDQARRSVEILALFGALILHVARFRPGSFDRRLHRPVLLHRIALLQRGFRSRVVAGTRIGAVAVAAVEVVVIVVFGVLLRRRVRLEHAARLEFRLNAGRKLDSVQQEIVDDSHDLLFDRKRLSVREGSGGQGPVQALLHDAQGHRQHRRGKLVFFARFDLLDRAQAQRVRGLRRLQNPGQQRFDLDHRQFLRVGRGEPVEGEDFDPELENGILRVLLGNLGKPGEEFAFTGRIHQRRGNRLGGFPADFLVRAF